MRKLIGIVLLVVAIAQLGHRGLQRVRHNIPLWDYASVYAASRTWIHGGDPYELQPVLKTWAESGLYTDRDTSYFATVYLPPSLLVLVPFAVMPAGVAMWTWLILTTILLALQFAALADMAKLRLNDGRVLILAGGALLTGAMQFGVVSGQLSMPAISLCCIAFWLAGRDREKLAGVLLGLACAIKPQVAGPFVLYYLALRRFKLSAFAILVGGGITVAAVAAMQLTHPHWIDGWRHSVDLTMVSGGVNDYSWASKYRDEIVDLRILTVSLIHDPRVQRAIVLGIVAVLVAWYVRYLPRSLRFTPGTGGGADRPHSRTELLALSVLAGIILLPVYHRVYDVTLLTLALAWALAGLDGPPQRRKYAIAALVPMCLFLIPWTAMQTFGKHLPALVRMSQKGWWQSTLTLHYAWALLAATIVLLAALTRESAASSEEPGALPADAISSRLPHEGRSSGQTR